MIEQPDHLHFIMQNKPNYLTGCKMKETGYSDGVSGQVELLQRRINDENYLQAAIQRLALVLSNEIMEITTASKMREGGRSERKRRK